MFQLSYNTMTGASGASWFMTLPITMYNFPFGFATMFLLLDRDVSDKALMTKAVYPLANSYKHGMDHEFLNAGTYLTPI